LHLVKDIGSFYEKIDFVKKLSNFQDYLSTHTI